MARDLAAACVPVGARSIAPWLPGQGASEATGWSRPRRWGIVAVRKLGAIHCAPTGFGAPRTWRAALWPRADSLGRNRMTAWRKCVVLWARFDAATICLSSVTRSWSSAGSPVIEVDVGSHVGTQAGTRWSGVQLSAGRKGRGAAGRAGANPGRISTARTWPYELALASSNPRHPVPRTPIANVVDIEHCRDDAGRAALAATRSPIEGGERAPAANANLVRAVRGRARMCV